MNKSNYFNAFNIFWEASSVVDSEIFKRPVSIIILIFKDEVHLPSRCSAIIYICAVECSDLIQLVFRKIV